MPELDFHRQLNITSLISLGAYVSGMTRFSAVRQHQPQLNTLRLNPSSSPLHVLLQFLKPNVLLGKCLGIDPVMIASSLRRAVRSHTSPQSISRPTTPSIAASLSSPSHQRRQSSSKPPIPPNDGPANITNPAVKTVGTPRSKDGAGQKRAGAESRLSRRKIPRDRSEHAPEGKDEWAINLPSVPSTQHLDPKGNDS